MIAQNVLETQVLWQPNVHRKINELPATIERLMLGVKPGQCPLLIPELPGRDVQVLPVHGLPKKPGLSQKMGQARLLHDLASIELQAMELALRTLIEFPEAPPEFRENLAQVCLEEGHHLRLCLEGLEDLCFPWGSFPVHMALWQSVSPEDSLLDRILIVHRYLEGSGLDASAQIQARLSSVHAPEVQKALDVIASEEVEHVAFGSYWYREICQREKIDSCHDFANRLNGLMSRIPRRLEKINTELRLSAGFLETELAVLRKLQGNDN